ncbi:MAG TPA: GTP cyclohydrolase II [Acidimicrobiales bacterium]|nr:GTP cyclohydrolase II [Acidimicrobiales bacterium]
MTTVELVAEALLPTGSGQFMARAYRSADGTEHVALVRGQLDEVDAVLVRVHSECLTGDVFGSLRCDCGPQLEQALEIVAARGVGIIVYLRGHEGRGIGIGQKLAAYRLQERGADTVDANTALGLPVDDRAYDVAAAILFDLRVKRVLLLTNNPAKQRGLEAAGIEVIERVPLVVASNPLNARYLRTKRDRLGHVLDELD